MNEKPTAAQEAIATADSYLNNAVLPTYSEVLAALRLLQATQRPFSSVNAYGLGLPYTADNCLTAAWESRTNAADIAVLKVLRLVDATLAGDLKFKAEA